MQNLNGKYLGKHHNLIGCFMAIFMSVVGILYFYLMMHFFGHTPMGAWFRIVISAPSLLLFIGAIWILLKELR